ncbi:hypothetical protein JTE90_012817 [Oedothorax gibbosus]|uniref:Cuticle protein 10.9-like n=1 Tax=Oedothorax gibbosus TaxID=931172 RepID=A0AAV6W0Q7_9ARAC|nr:hypothetical protein JTE90_012817 [Oedothorax gibbosus]
MKVLIVLSALIVAITCQRYQDQPEYPPIPYSFSYAADLEDGGSSSHQESGDGSGRVTGSYTVQGEGGVGRVVDYVADENGFRATIRTNEPGTASQNPADVTIDSSADQAPSVRTAPVAPVRPVAPVNPRTGIRYILVPITDPRAAGYY